MYFSLTLEHLIDEHAPSLSTDSIITVALRRKLLWPISDTLCKQVETRKQQKFTYIINSLRTSDLFAKGHMSTNSGCNSAHVYIQFYYL